MFIMKSMSTILVKTVWYYKSIPQCKMYKSRYIKSNCFRYSKFANYIIPIKDEFLEVNNNILI